MSDSVNNEHEKFHKNFKYTKLDLIYLNGIEMLCKLLWKEKIKQRIVHEIFQ